MKFLYLAPLLNFVVPLVLMLAVGGPLIAKLKNLKGMKWSPREDTPDSHLQKAGTPSMGGIGIIGSTLIGLLGLISAFIVFERTLSLPLDSILFWLSAFVTLHAVLGFVDDWSKARGKGGLLARQKLAGQVVLAVAFLAVLANYESGTSDYEFMNLVRHGWQYWASMLLLFLVIVGTSNAVNITDGIDGLVAGLSVQCCLVFTIWSLLDGFGIVDEDSWRGLSLSTALFWLCLGGACLGFLRFNKYPAKVFMGDTGSLAIGAALGAGAITAHCVQLLPFFGFIFFVETFSVVLQVAYFKFTKKKYGEGRRIFRRAPLHHHFELGGWSERRVVGTFWAINAVTSLMGMGLWKAGILPRFP